MADKHELIFPAPVLYDTPKGPVAICFNSGQSAYVTMGMNTNDGTGPLEIRGVAYRLSSHMNLVDGRFVPSESNSGISLWREDHQNASRAAEKAAIEFLVEHVNACADAHPEAVRQGGAVSVNNDLHRVEREIEKAEAALNALHAQRDALLVQEEAFAPDAPAMRR